MSSGNAEISLAGANEGSSNSALNSQFDGFYGSGLENESGEFNDFSGNAPGNEDMAAMAGLSPPVGFGTLCKGFHTYY